MVEKSRYAADAHRCTNPRMHAYRLPPSTYVRLRTLLLRAAKGGQES